jgi:hypothetical protein
VTDPAGFVEVPLTQGYVAIIDAADADAVLAHKWCAQVTPRSVYARRSVRRPDGQKTSQYMHTFLTGYGRTDHRNGDGLDNRRVNLREAEARQNSWNVRRHVDSTGGYKGVSWHRRDQRWIAQIAANGTRTYLGYFTIAEEAARAYDVAARELHGEYAALNFPLPGERAA